MTATITEERTMQIHELVSPYPERVVGSVTITQKKKTDNYDLLVNLDPVGGIWNWQKLPDTRSGPYEEIYRIPVSKDGVPLACTCKGFRGHGHCKHVAATAKLIELQRIPSRVTKG